MDTAKYDSAVKAPNPSMEMDGDDVVISLSSHVGIAVVKELHARLQQALREMTPVCLDGNDVERIDAAALQLLWAFVQEAGRHHLNVSWRQPSANLVKAASLLGLASTMGIASP